ncbi:Mur ligase family protein [Flavobacteriaceae bacterium]|nr:peptidoglycan synthetase [Flavobacteriaceae bacterium]MDA7765640.1 Mur ligase family protein [Flavobacteriaceae bacterium]MDB4128815.1 Mur ligase family protein [Flavobacteriaceae bacterium]MDC0103111.1 Mur ligase family protein [Flavobacteriaceae bacterium]MDC0133434.1 Mur ligase family protein [Flavobacteriaceae bacterium]
MQLHFIAIGGSAMHSLALAMHRLGHRVTGSDDAIFDPSKTKLEQANLLPDTLGWHPEKLNNEIDVVLLGMHAKADNPELIMAQALGLKIQSYPEFLASMCKEKSTVVVAGSHGKTTITAMVLHVLNYHGVSTDFMIGAPVPAVTETLSISDENDFILLEGDEYLSSAIDSQPKFLWYKPEIALISGIAWDHVNVFPTFEDYISQFEKFIYSIVEGGVLFYNEEDKELKSLVENCSHPVKKIPYGTPEHTLDNGITYLNTSEGSLPLSVFGTHNLMNLAGARWISQLMGVDVSDFYEAIPSFTGAAKRMERLAKGKTAILFKDFAHAPSKVSASAKAVKSQFSRHKIKVCLELHTYSSLDATFIKQYKDSLTAADEAIVFYDPEALKIKNRAPIDPDAIKKAFNHSSIEVITEAKVLQKELFEQEYVNYLLVMMSSGNFGDLDWEKLKQVITIF